MHIKTITTAAMLSSLALLAGCAGMLGQGSGKHGLQMPGKAAPESG